MGFCSKGLKNEFKTAVVNEPSVFEPLKFNCIQDLAYSLGRLILRLALATIMIYNERNTNISFLHTIFSDIKAEKRIHKCLVLRLQTKTNHA